ncbi:potassium channel family protein [Qipengyuania atrilutea]|uniref:potassium channel family protein n=1 Tax=Qipengyuania atrilutea TaxID=2744473 RepID=UPI001C3D2CB7|nr:TrkA family potassium uptake protein [Actirhodobacter atriluteus]
MSARRKHRPVLVIGLGRFGVAVARSLTRMGHEVMAIDTDPACIQAMCDELTQAVEADATEPETLRRLGAAEFETAVVGIGSNLEASVLTVLALSDLGVPKICAKAINEAHARILERTGATVIVQPEARMGERVAHVIGANLIDFIQFDDDFAIAKMRAPDDFAGRTLEETGIRTQHGITVVGIKRPQQDFVYAVPDTEVRKDDLLIVSGPTTKVERFAALSS